MRVAPGLALLVTLVSLGPSACSKGDDTFGRTDAGPPGSSVRTIELDTFSVPPGGEVYKCQNFPNPFGSRDVAIRRVSSDMTNNSHHLLVFVTGSPASTPLEDCSGLEFNTPVVYGTQQAPTDEMTYPDGLAVVLKATNGLRLQSHYINPTSSYLTVHVKVDFESVPIETVHDHVGIMLLSDSNLNVLPHTTQTVTGSCHVQADVSFLYASSHMHSHGTQFTSTAGGQPLFDATSWQDPRPQLYQPPVSLKKGDEVKWSCTYVNNSDTTLTFGQSALSNEMCILVVQFYPFPEDLLGNAESFCQ